MTVSNLFRFAGWACIVAIAALSLMPPTQRPVTALPHGFEHCAIFAITGFALAFGYPNGTRLQVPMLTLFAAFIEVAQLYVPGRHARVMDFLIDALAASAGALSVTILRRLAARRRGNHAP